MTGEQLKIQLLKIEPTLVAVANKLGVSKQNLDAKLSASDIKTGFVERLAALYRKPIGFFFGEDKKTHEQHINDSPASINGNHNANNCVNDSKLLEKALDEIAEHRKLLSVAQGHISELTAVVLNMTKMPNK